VHLGEDVSSRRIQKIGIRQGSVLAPTLFNLYTNDLPVTGCRKFIYADDICLETQYCWTSMHSHSRYGMHERILPPLTTQSKCFQDCVQCVPLTQCQLRSWIERPMECAESSWSWSRHLFRGRPGGRCYVWSGGRLSDALTWSWRVLSAGVLTSSQAVCPKRSVRRVVADKPVKSGQPIAVLRHFGLVHTSVFQVVVSVISGERRPKLWHRLLVKSTCLQRKVTQTGQESGKYRAWCRVSGAYHSISG